MNKVILYIDGENLRHYIKDVFRENNVSVDDPSLLNINFGKLFDKLLKGFEVNEKVYYCAKLRQNKETSKKSKELIQKQRILKTKLEREGFSFIMSGNVRAQRVEDGKKTKLVFREKGVDVKIAVDLVVAACDKKVKTVILCSSDSDLQPAVEEVKSRGVEVVYVGFEINPNKGLIYTTSRAILVRNSEVMECFDKNQDDFLKFKKVQKSRRK